MKKLVLSLLVAALAYAPAALADGCPGTKSECSKQPCCAEATASCPSQTGCPAQATACSAKANTSAKNAACPKSGTTQAKGKAKGKLKAPASARGGMLAMR